MSAHDLPHPNAATQATPPPPQGAGQKAFGELAPRFAELTDQLLFADIWQRPGLSPRERSLITVAALIAMNRVEQQPFHMARALNNGLTRDQLVEVITHLAFYGGWPCAASALGPLRSVLADRSKEG